MFDGMHKVTAVNNAGHTTLSQRSYNMRHYRDRNFHSSRQSNESTLWNHIQQVCRREEDIDRRLTAAVHLQEFVAKPTYKMIISRNLDQALNSLLDVFFERSVDDLQKKVVTVLAHIGMTLAYDAYPLFQWFLRQFQTIANDNVRSYLLQGLSELLQKDQNFKYFGKIIGLLMDELQILLESVDVAEQLSVCVEPLIFISQSYHQVLAKHFRDIVDILVGWHIDHTQSMSLIMFCADALIKLQPHWQNDMEFSLMLLNQFLEDMEAYAEVFHKLHSEDPAGDIPEDETSLPKIAALMRAFSTVVRSIGSLFNIKENTLITESFVLEMLQRVIVCAQLVGEASYTVTCAANECMQLLISAVQWRGEEMLSETLLTYVVHGVERSHSEPRILLVLRLLTVMVQEIGSALPAWFIVGLLGPSSRLLPLKYNRNPRVTSELLSLYQACLSIKNVSLLQTAYRNVVGELQLALNSLLKIQNVEEPEISILKDDPFLDAKLHSPTEKYKGQNNMDGKSGLRDYEEQYMLKTALFDITALSEVADAKNSIIGMYALSPSIFELLHTELFVVHEELGAAYPHIQYAVLCTLYSHCQRHKNFVSSYLGGSTPHSPIAPQTSPATVTTVTHGHYPLILSLISRLLVRKISSDAIRMLLLHWVQELLENIREFKESYVSLMSEPHFSSLVHSMSILGTNRTDELAFTVIDCLSTVFSMLNAENVANALPTTSSFMYESGLHVGLTHIYNIDGKLQKSSFELLRKIPLDQFTRYAACSLQPAIQNDNLLNAMQLMKTVKNGKRRPEINILNQPLKSMNARYLWSSKRAHMTRVLTTESTFNLHHFRTVIHLLLRGILSTDCAPWLERIYWSCQRSDLRPMICQHQTVASNFGFVYWWALWECAVFTVSNKLRTSLGRPQDTFQKIEGALREYEQQLSTAAHTSVRRPQGSIKLPSGRTPQDSVQSKMQKPHLLLQFLYFLEKLMFNAYSGCVSIAQPNKAVRTFFSTNRSTCEQWMNRLRLAAMKIALNCGLPCTAFYHGQKILEDMKVNNNTQGAEFERAVLMTIEAAMALECPQVIEGMYRWCRDVSKSQNPSLSTIAIKQTWAWMKPAKNQANHCYEDASKEYVAIYNNLTKKDSEKATNVSMQGTRYFIMQQISSCYVALNDWEKASKWIKQCKSQTTDPIEKFLPSMDHIEALRNFEEGDFTKATEKCKNVLHSLTSVSGTLKQVNGKPTTALDELKTWRWANLLKSSEMHILLSCMNTDSKQASSKLEKVRLAAESVLQLNMHYWPTDLSSDFLSVFMICKCLETGEMQPLSKDIFKTGSWNTANNRLLTFLESPFAQEKDFINEEGLFNLQLATCSMHRKRGNFDRCTRLFKNMIKVVTPNGVSEGTEKFTDLKELLQVCEKSRDGDDTKVKFLLDVQCELSKELISVGNNMEGIGLMVDTLLCHLGSGQNNEKCGRIMLSLAKNLHAEWKTVSPVLLGIVGNAEPPEEKNELFTKLNGLVNHHKLQPFLQNLCSSEQLLDEASTEIILGTLLNAATVQAPDLAKAWFDAAGWCYKWGRKVVDSASNSGQVELTDDEKGQVQSILAPYEVSDENLSQIYKIISQAHYSSIQDDDIISQQQDNKSDTSEIIYGQLLACCSSWLPQNCETVIHNLLLVWQNVCMHLFSQYQAAANAYFKFLRLNVSKKTTVTHEDSNVIATLRLLRLLAKHALELQVTLKDGLEKTPTTPWNGIIPQLFSRLNHPEPYVRQSISDLLCRVAKDAPHLVVYPVVVATTHADRKSRAVLRNANLDTLDPEDENEMGDGNSLREKDGENMLTVENEFEGKRSKTDKSSQSSSVGGEAEGTVNACYHSVRAALREENENMVNDAQLLVLELCRITLLWDELWLGTLNQHHQDIMRRLHQLHDEAKRVNSNHSLSKDEKHAILREQQQAIMRPVIYALQRIQRITCAVPETPHEKWFSENMQPLIDQAMKRLTQHPNPQHPNSCWSGFKQLHFQLTQRASKRSSQILNLGEISPKLMELNSTSMPIPGVTIGNNEVTIQGCSSIVTILPTKTKPKKLQFIGSNAQRYTFLFKGLEDLHLDERIMQFLFITNQLLKRQHENTSYAARHYAVTPLGARSGLIQWVDGATPLFTLYKRWQQRQALHKATATNSVPKPVLRPSEVYYSKLNPALKEAGIDVDKISRKDWPSNVMCEVLKGLISDTPPDLLQRELWCSSTSAAKYWDIQQKYSCSTAVMSMIGYIIGLGDRHLDNVLVDLETGEVVHIDYNICFEKGAQLRVPERVPFRLTQNIKTALGLTGVEGVFRHACEQVVSTLRKGRETLLTLLEAFVYDPLVDWTGTVEGGYAGAVYGGGGQQGDGALTNKLSKHDMEREITRSLFSSRVAEMKRGWLDNRDEMLKALPEVIDHLQDYKKHFNNHVDFTNQIQNMFELKAQVKTSVSDIRHPFNSLKGRWTQHKLQQSKKDTILHSIKDKLSICDVNIQKYKTFVATTQSPELAALLADVSCPLKLGEATFESAIPFLNSAGQATMVSQAQATEKELLTVSEQCRLALRSCLDALTTYAARAAQFPPTAVITNHQEAIWSSKLRRLAASLLDSADSDVANGKQDAKSAKDSISSLARLAAVKDATLQQEVSDLNNFLVKLLERRERNVQGQDRTALEKPVNIYRDHILNFVQENGFGGMDSIISVLTLALDALEQRGLTMESTAAKAGHRLVDMTSQDGDWFLEELCSLFGNVVQLLGVLDQVLKIANSNSTLNMDAVQGVLNADACFRSLMDLFNNFRNIILPEAVKLLQCEESSVIELTNSFNALLQGVKLDDYAKQLISALRSTSALQCNEVLASVNNLQALYNQLLHDFGQSQQEEQRLTAGQMLLQGFNGLFYTVHSNFLKLIQMQNHLFEHTQKQWYVSVDVLSEPDELQKIKDITNAKEPILQSLLFVKQLQAMHDFFVLCQSNARSFVIDRQAGQGPHYTSSKNLYSEERLMKPVKHFIAHFVQELMIGIPSQVLGMTLCSCLALLGVDVDREIENKMARNPHAVSPIVIDEVCKNVVEEKYTQAALTKQRLLIYNFNRAWKDLDRAQRLDSNIAAVRASLQRSQLQLSRFQWLHEDILLETSSPNFAHPRRFDVLADLSKRMHTLKQLDGLFQQLQDTAITQNKSILQRLKWAAGANPSLQSVLQEVEKSIQRRGVVMRKEAELSTKVSELCSTAVNFEESRIKVGGGNRGANYVSPSEKIYLAIMESCEQIQASMAHTPVKITNQEMALVNVMVSKSSGDTLIDDWLSKAGDLLQSRITNYKQARQQEETKMQTVKSKLISTANTVKQLLTIHSRLLSDVKSLLKVLAKDGKSDGKGSRMNVEDETQEDETGSVASVRLFLDGYKAFCVKLNDLLRDVLQGCDGSTMSDPDPLIQRLTEITHSVSRIYDSLVNLATPLPGDRTANTQPSFATALRVGTQISKNVEENDDKNGVTAVQNSLSALSVQDGANQNDSCFGDSLKSGGKASKSARLSETQSGANVKATSPKKKPQDPRTGKAIQERNCFAVSVWRRVKAKLDGRDLDFGRRMQISEQVDYIINEATSVENLALLYEGWTAWV